MHMNIQTGKVVGGVIVVDDPSTLEEGATVTIVTGSSDQSVEVDEETERELLERIASVERGETIDAKEAMRTLREAKL